MNISVIKFNEINNNYDQIFYVIIILLFFMG